MASTAAGSQSPPLATVSTYTLERQRQAGPLPIKAPLVGEIGYQAISELPQDLQEVDLGDSAAGNPVTGLDAAEVDIRNGRHTADRSGTDLDFQSSTSLPVPNGDGETAPNANDSTTPLNTIAKHSLFSFPSFASKSYHGVTVGTLLRLIILFLIQCGWICAWVFVSLHFKASSSSSSSDVQSPNGGNSAIFVHIAFTIFMLIFILFFERLIFRLRAERYAHLHPGEILPSYFHRGHASMGPIGLVPWNRAPLPTYAAALGVRGTGDVEDNDIAAPPPPEYGNTRESTLLLSSILRQSRSNNRSRSSVQAEQRVERPAANTRISVASTGSLPISYAEVEHQDDVERAIILEEALAKLEDSARGGQLSLETSR